MTAASPALPSTRSVLGLLHLPGGDPSATAAAADRLRRLYAPVLPGCTVQARWLAAPRCALVVVSQTGAAPTDRGCWGEPGGSWVRWEVSEHDITLTTSGSTVTTLRRAQAAGATAWATRSLAAVALSGAHPSVRRDVVAEYVLLDCTLGDDDLLDGVVRLPDATVLRMSSQGPVSRRWADDGERLSPGPPTTAPALRAAALGAAAVAAEVPDAALGLTAGRDSGLLAAALVVSGARPPTFTLGWAGLPDVDGAVHRAAALGLPHRTMALHDLRGEALDGERAVSRALHRRYPTAEVLRALRVRTRWSDGNEVPRNALLGGVVAAGPPVVWLSGSGGELARALYWHDGAPGTPARQMLLGPRVPAVADPAAAGLGERVDAELALAASWGRDGTGGLDVLYLRSRMRNWLGNVAPLEAFAGYVAGLLEPGLVRALLDVPEEQRRDGSLFDQATAGLLAEAAGRTVGAAPAAAVGRRLLPRARRDPLSDWRLLDRLLRHLERHGPQVARQVMGETWWRQTRAHAPSRPYARQWLWNAVAVDALALVCDEV